jgi:NAD(P)-dependent dehydrogenase (short-subunit alcohol dehydrogenase family)
MVERRDGHILSTASEAGIVPEGGGYLYSLSKYAVVGLSESLRVELGPLGIGVSVLIPGPVATTIVENTKARRPDTAPQHSERTAAILTMAHDWLLSQGRSPDDVGALVLDAVRENRPYVFTRKDNGPALTARTDAMLAAMKHDHEYLEALATPARMTRGA